jgi:hypothetical protein
MTEGKTTMKSLWGKMRGKNTNVEALNARISELEETVMVWTHILDYLTIYIAQVVLPRFKRERGSHYFNFLTNFASCHIESCTKTISDWEPIMEKADQ